MKKRPTVNTFKAHDALIAMQTARGRREANKRLTELLCSGYRMAEAVAQIASEDVTLGIHAADLALERS